MTRVSDRIAFLLSVLALAAAPFAARTAIAEIQPPDTERTVWVRGNVHEADSTGRRAPIKGALVEVRGGEADIAIYPPPPPAAKTFTDENGDYTMAVPADLLVPARISAAHRGFLAQTKRIESLPATGLQVDFALVPISEPPATVWVKGHVREIDSAGKRVPVGGARVEARGGEIELPVYPPLPPDAFAFTDPTGFYKMAVPADILLPARILAKKQGYHWGFEIIEDLPATGLTVDFILVRLVPPTPTATPEPTDTPTPTPTTTPIPPPEFGYVHGVVYDVSPSTTIRSDTSPSSPPLPGALVTVWLPYTSDENASLRPLGKAITDDNGRYRIDNLPAGVPLLARATKEGYTFQNKGIEGLTAEGLRLDFALERRVLPTPTPTPTAPPSDETGLCGFVRVATPLTVVLPIAGAVVELYPATAPPGWEDGTRLNEGDSTVRPEPIARAVTDREGHFCLVPLAPGWYHVKATAEGHMPEFRRVHVPDGKIKEILLALKPIPTPTATPPPSPAFGAIAGRVVLIDENTPDGHPISRPCPGVEILAFPLPVPVEEDLAAAAANDAPSVPPLARAITDADGRYKLVWLPAGPCLVVARKPGLLPERKEATVVAGTLTPLSFEMTRLVAPTPIPTPTPGPTPPPVETGAIHGRVFDDRSTNTAPRPVAGADVVVFPAEAATRGDETRPVPVLGRTVTNEHGFYRIGALPPVPVVVKAFKPGYMPGTVRADVQPSTSTLVNIALTAVSIPPTPTATPPPNGDARVVGRVFTVGPDGQRRPVEGAKVCLYSPLLSPAEGAEAGAEPVACARTDARGYYYLVVEAGTYVGVAAALGFERAVQRVELVPGPNPALNFALKPAVAPTPPPPPPVGAVEGRVTVWQSPFIDDAIPADAIPAPLPDALVTLYRADRTTGRFEDPVARTRSDEDGRFAFDEVPAGLYIGVAEKRGFERDVQSFAVKPEETARVAFALKPLIVEPTPTPDPTPAPPPGGLVGRVVTGATDDATTRPLAGAAVTVYRVNRRDRTDLAARPVATVATDAEGWWRVGALAPGEYVVVAHARGFEPGRVACAVRSDEVTRVRHVLTPLTFPDPTLPGAIAGEVLRPSTRVRDRQRGEPPMAEALAFDPVEGSTVTTYLVALDPVDPALLVPSGQAVTDADGTFEILPLRPGVHLVVAQAEGLLPAVRLARVAPGDLTWVQLILRGSGRDAAPEPVPPSRIIEENRPADSEHARWEPQDAPSAFMPPVAERRDGWLILRSRGNNTFGYWQSVRGWIPRRPDSLYVVSFTAASDQTDPTRSPSLRLRANSDSLRQTDIFRIDSLGDAGLAPTPEGTSYRMVFEPMDLGEVDTVERDGINIAFDLLNFDRRIAPDAELALRAFEVVAVPTETLGEATLLKEWTFEDGAAGWMSGGASGIFEVAEAEVADRALRLRARRQGNVFGFWSSPNDAFELPAAGELVRATFEIAGNQTDPSRATQLRVRLNSADNQTAVLKVVPSIEDGANSPTPTGKSYSIYLEVPPALAGKGLYVSVDLLGFDPDDADDNAIELERVRIEHLPALAFD